MKGRGSGEKWVTCCTVLGVGECSRKLPRPLKNTDAPGMTSGHLWGSRESMSSPCPWKPCNSTSWRLPGAKSILLQPLNSTCLQTALPSPLRTFHFKASPVDPRAPFELLIIHPSPECVSLALPSRLSCRKEKASPCQARGAGSLLAGPSAEGPVTRSAGLTGSPRANTHS